MSESSSASGAPGRGSLLDRVGSKVPGDDSEMANLEQDLRVLAKLRKDILSGKHPLYKPTPKSASSSDLSDRLGINRPAAASRETALSLSERITPNPAMDTQKEEQDFFNSIAQSLPAGMSRSLAKRSSDEEATRPGGDEAKRPRTDSRDHPASEGHYSREPPSARSQADTRSANDRSRFDLETERPSDRDRERPPLQRVDSNPAYRRRDRADSRGSNGIYAANAYLKADVGQAQRAAHTDRQKQDRGENLKKVDKFAKQRLPPAPIDTKATAPVPSAQNYPEDRSLARSVDERYRRDDDPALRESARRREEERPQSGTLRSRPLSPDPRGYDNRDFRRQGMEDRRPSPPPPVRGYRAPQDLPDLRRIDDKQAMRQEPPYSGSRMDIDRRPYPEPARSSVRGRSRSPPRTYPPGKPAPIDSRAPFSASYRRPPSPEFIPRPRQTSPPPARYATSARPPSPSPPRREVRAGELPRNGMRDDRREPPRPEVYGQEIGMPGRNDYRGGRSGPTAHERLPEVVARAERAQPNLPARPAPIARDAGAQRAAQRRDSLPLGQDGRIRTETNVSRTPSGEIGRKPLDARDVRDPRGANTAHDQRRSGDGLSSLTGRIEPRPETRLPDRNGYNDARNAPASAREAAGTSRLPARDAMDRDVDRRALPDTARPPIPHLQADRADPYENNVDIRAAYSRDDRYRDAPRMPELVNRSHERRRSASPPRTTRDARPGDFRDDWDRSRARPYDDRALPRQPPASARAGPPPSARSDNIGGPASYPYYDMPDARGRYDDRPPPASARDAFPPPAAFPPRGALATPADYRGYPGTDSRTHYEFSPPPPGYGAEPRSAGYYPPARDEYPPPRPPVHQPPPSAGGYRNEPAYRDGGRPEDRRDAPYYEQRDAPKGYWPPPPTGRPVDDRYREPPSQYRR